VPYPTNQLNTRFHSTTRHGLSSTQQKPVNRDSQRQAALSQMEKSTGKTFPQTRTGTKDVQRQASSEQLKQISQRNNYRGYDTKPQTAKRTTTQQRENRQTTTQRQEKRVSQPAQQRALQQRNSQPRANALSGNDSRSANWQAQQQRGAQSRQLAAASSSHVRRLVDALNAVNSTSLREPT
jgi:thiamine kinase-like enzyme